MQGNSRVVSTNQQDVHEKIPELVEKYLHSENKKPIQAHTQAAFRRVEDWLDNATAIILDSCCGKGESTQNLASKYPDAKVIGIDKSALRISKHQHTEATPSISQQSEEVQFYSQDNYCLVRAEVIDFWRLVVSHQWPVTRHCIYYPNPYPKSAQVQRRWHASASIKDIIAIGGHLEVRSNWKLYIQEFAVALKTADRQPLIFEVEKGNPITAFERKYWNSGQDSWHLDCQL